MKILISTLALGLGMFTLQNDSCNDLEKQDTAPSSVLDTEASCEMDRRKKVIPSKL